MIDVHGPVKINRTILDFINTNKVATVCCSSGNKPHCFNVFYSIIEEEGCLVFKSSDNSRHMQILGDNNLVAGTVIASEISMSKVEGIQFEGVIIDDDHMGYKAGVSYYLRFPFAVAVPGKLWVIELQSVKYTNTCNGIKHKLDWQR